ncbi:MAG: pyridoxamine 5'-phosphate oxidase family protein [Leptolyngbyaceae cyanobacterium bins.59]|nr:pyridoxamine 5'-phosphate oxidase family protein [Leptolyngbyaceae cyanobacterium bins.59]
MPHHPIPLAPWRPVLAGILHRNRSVPYSRYLQLATVRPDGRPANRTIVFRGFLENTNQLKFVTDARSEKADQIAQCDWGEVCWYFTQTREQMRLGGQLTLICENYPDSQLQQVRQMSWQELSDAARSQFAWPHPGKARSETTAFTVAPPDAMQPLSHFCLLLLDPIEVDHLELRGDPQNRTLYHWVKNDWTVEAVNP